MADAIAELGGDTDGDTVPGLAHEELAQLSHHVDLLVVGSRSYGPLRRLLLGAPRPSSRMRPPAPCSCSRGVKQHNQAPSTAASAGSGAGDA
jgi:hypothetical protein